MNTGSQKHVTKTKFTCLLFCNNIMTGEPVHSASKERMAPGLRVLADI